MNKFNLILLLIPLLQFCGTDIPFDKRDITVINKTNRSIYYYYSSNDSIGGDKLIYKTLDCFIIQKYDYRVLCDKPRNWTSYIENGTNMKMRIFIILKDTVDKYGWEEIKLKNIYSKVYKVDMEYLAINKWCINYDGK